MSQNMYINYLPWFTNAQIVEEYLVNICYVAIHILNNVSLVSVDSICLVIHVSKL